MMINDLVNETALKYILSDIELTCRRLGINAQFSIKKDDDFNGLPYERVVSTNFQTTPMIFKEIHIDGNIYAQNQDDVIRIVVNMEYRYQTFTNGYNGCELGKIIYDVDKRYNGIRPKNAHLYIEKVKSINI